MEGLCAPEMLGRVAGKVGERPLSYPVALAQAIGCRTGTSRGVPGDCFERLMVLGGIPVRFVFEGGWDCGPSKPPCLPLAIDTQLKLVLVKESFGREVS